MYVPVNLREGSMQFCVSRNDIHIGGAKKVWSIVFMTLVSKLFTIKCRVRVNVVLAFISYLLSR